MHTDARQLENNTRIAGDVCIIGAGAAGISIALEWINSPLKVILLESGGFDYEGEIQDLYRGKRTGLPYYPLESSRLRYFGGSTGHWAGFCSPLDPIDFKSRDWVPHSGWPFGAETLAPYYKRAHHLLELSEFEYDWRYWNKKDPDFEPLPFDEDVIIPKLWQFSAPTRFGKRYRKNILEASNVELFTYATVTSVNADQYGKQVTSVTVKNMTGKTLRVDARYFVIATGGIQNAALLLASNNVMPHGIGNDHDQVGRYFMEHLEITAADLLLDRPHYFSAYMLDFFFTKVRIEMAVHEKQQVLHKILNATAAISVKESDQHDNAAPGNRKEDEITSTGKSNQSDKHLRGWETAEKYYHEQKPEKPKPRQSTAFELFCRIEQAPDPDSRVTLDIEKDPLGFPRAALHWKFGSLERYTLRKLLELIGQQAGLSGLGRLKMKDWLADEGDAAFPSTVAGGWHHMGTTRMHDDKKQGVVDADCKVHGIGNLYVAGSSCFATAGAANPTLTLVAMALRLSDYLKQKLGRCEQT